MEAESGEIDLYGNTLESLLHCIKNGEVLSKKASPSIYMVPSMIRDLSPSSFTPKVVSIGPLHRQDEHLQAFEVQKTTYLYNWLYRLGRAPDQTMGECLQKVIRSIERIKACYAGSTTYDDLELAKMMVIDACFILEFIQSLSEGVLSNKLIRDSIILDLLLIENQIPYFVLENIYECTVLPSGLLREGVSLTMHIQILLNYYYLFRGILVVPHASNPGHILGLLHEYFRPAEPIPPVFDESEPNRKRHSAMELDRAGMNFKPNKDENWALAMKLELPLPLFPWFHIFMDIPPFSWFRRPTLRMPKVHIDDDSELILRNLIVYEQSFGVEKYVTAYLNAMDMLIDTPEDVALLVRSKVLASNFGSNEEAADMKNNLCKNINIQDFYYDREWEEMDAYYNRHWPHFIAGLKCTYFSNPWSVVALIAAFLLFALTVVQTIFTINAA